MSRACERLPLKVDGGLLLKGRLLLPSMYGNPLQFLICTFTLAMCPIVLSPQAQMFSLGYLSWGPTWPTHIWPSLWPVSMHTSSGLPRASEPRKPPANMSPAPLVSMIWSSASLDTGKVLGFGSASVRLALMAAEALEDGEDEATMVDSAPWVITTSRGRDAFDFGRLAMVVAIWPTVESCGQAQQRWSGISVLQIEDGAAHSQPCPGRWRTQQPRSRCRSRRRRKAATGRAGP